MRISFDLDGTAWRYQAFFAELARTLQAQNHEVGILTAHAEELRAADLRLWRSRGFPAPDFFYNHADMRAAFPRGTVEGVRNLKIAFAESVGIDCHIDDFDNRHPDELELVLIPAGAGAGRTAPSRKPPAVR